MHESKKREKERERERERERGREGDIEVFCAIIVDLFFGQKLVDFYLAKK